jgi:hypothetical protein
MTEKQESDEHRSKQPVEAGLPHQFPVFNLSVLDLSVFSFRFYLILLRGIRMTTSPVLSHRIARQTRQALRLSPWLFCCRGVRRTIGALLTK